MKTTYWKVSDVYFYKIGHDGCDCLVEYMLQQGLKQCPFTHNLKCADDIVKCNLQLIF